MSSPIWSPPGRWRTLWVIWGRYG